MQCANVTLETLSSSKALYPHCCSRPRCVMKTCRMQKLIIFDCQRHYGIASYSPVQTIPRVAGAVRRELIFFTTDRPHCILNAPTFRGQSRLSGFGCVLDHCATTFGACAHSMKTAVRYQLRTQGFAPEPINRRGGEGRSLIERSDYRIGGGIPRDRGTSPATRGIVWTGR